VCDDRDGEEEPLSDDDEVEETMVEGDLKSVATPQSMTKSQ
jgi:hypothetical protein